MLSDFPVALLGTAPLWDALGLLRGEPIWWALSFWGIALGLATAALAAVAGLVDYAAIPESDPAVGPATRHLLAMSGAVGLYLMSLVLRGGPGGPTDPTLIAILALESLGLVLLFAGGWYGGELVFRHGIGRDPNQEDERGGGHRAGEGRGARPRADRGDGPEGPGL